MRILSPLPVISVLLLPFACVQDPEDIPPSFSDNPVFFASLQFGTETVNFTAGQNGYRLTPQYSIDDRGVGYFSAVFAASDCHPPCPLLEIGFYGKDLHVDPAVDVEAVASPGEKSYFLASTDENLEVTFELHPQPNTVGSSFWSIAGFNTLSSATQTLQLTTHPSEYIDVCFQSIANTGCSGFAHYCFHALASSVCTGKLQADKLLGDRVLVEAIVNGKPPYTYQWMNGATTPVILLPLDTGTERGVNVRVWDAHGCRIDISQTILMTQGVPQLCGGSPEFEFSVAAAPFDQFTTAIIRYRDAGGNLYSTAWGPQDDALFAVHSTEAFDPAPSGAPSKKVTIAMEALLYTEDASEMLRLHLSDAVIGLSY